MSGGVESRDIQLADANALPYRDNAEIVLQQGQGTQKPGRHGVRRVHRQIPALRQVQQPGNMIGVLMGNEHSADLFHSETQASQGRHHSALGDSGVDQYSCLPILQQQAVAA